MDIYIQGHIVQIDKEDLQLILQYKWFFCGKESKEYIRRKGNIYPHTNIKDKNGKWRIRPMHRIIMGMAFSDKKLTIDHIDGNCRNNQKANLRVCTIADNNCNVHERKDNTSGFKGVSIKAGTDVFVAQIQVNKKKYFGGHHKSAIEAAIAYDRLAIMLHGEYAHTNFPITNYIKELRDGQTED